MNRTALTAVVLVAAALSGCLAGQAPGPAEPTDDVTDDVSSGTSTNLSQAATVQHVHDVWKGRSKITLVDTDYEMDAVRANATGDGAATDRVRFNNCDDDSSIFGIGIEAWCLGRRSFRPPASNDTSKPNVVAPGTKRVTMTVSWSDPTIQGISLEVFAANGEEVSPWGGFPFSASGETHEIKAKDLEDRDSYYEEEDEDDDENVPYFPLPFSDDGHSSRSKWRFVAKAYGQFGEFLAVADGTIHVTIETHRTGGDLPIEPPHPDWYSRSDTYHVVHAEDTVSNAYQVDDLSTHDADVEVFQPANPIPPTTKEVVARVQVQDDSFMKDSTGLDVTLGYTVNGWSWWDTDYTYLDPVESNGTTYTFRIPVEDWMTDSLYSCGGQNSTWAFRSYVRQGDAVGADQSPDGESHQNAGHFAGTIEMDVAATQRIGAAWDDLDRTEPENVEGCSEVSSYYS